MIKHWLLAAAMAATMGTTFAQVDVNKADVAALDGVKGIGAKKAQLIIDERSKGGPFKDWADFEKRVKGVKEKSAHKLSAAGLTVGGKSLDGAEARVAAVPKKAVATAK